jgi:hypothetical protein
MKTENSWNHFWLAESKHYPALYFLDIEKARNCFYKTNTTRDAYKAKRFNSKEECLVECENIKYPLFYPVQHSFID